MLRCFGTLVTQPGQCAVGIAHAPCACGLQRQHGAPTPVPLCHCSLDFLFAVCCGTCFPFRPLLATWHSRWRTTYSPQRMRPLGRTGCVAGTTAAGKGLACSMLRCCCLTTPSGGCGNCMVKLHGLDPGLQVNQCRNMRILLMTVACHSHLGFSCCAAMYRGQKPTTQGA